MFLHVTCGIQRKLTHATILLTPCHMHYIKHNVVTCTCMSHVEFRKCSCCHVGCMSLGPYQYSQITAGHLVIGYSHASFGHLKKSKKLGDSEDGICLHVLIELVEMNCYKTTCMHI